MRRVRARTLRARLTVLLVVVLVAATAVVGVVTALALRTFLTGRLDAQLAAAGARFAVSLEVPDDDDADNVVPGQAVGTLGVRWVDGTVTQSEVIDARGRTVAATLTADDVRDLAALSVGGAPGTIDLDRLHDYRLQAVAGRDGEVQITGLPESDVDATMRRLIAVEVVLFVAVIAAAATVVAVLVRRTLRPLHAVAETARHVASLPLTSAATPLPAPPVTRDSTSEVGHVATAFEQMLDHIRHALDDRDATEARLRQFVADASHEFRTPLATIRAHTELVQHAPDPLTPDVAHALDRIDAATVRMSSMVEDLLLLARLDDDGPPGERVDLSQVVVEAVVEARDLAPDHRWRLVLPDTPVEVVGHAGRLHRMVVNLLANARIHTPAGSTVEVSLVTAAAGVALAVADDGPGIAASARDTLFDRFTRGDTSRTSSSGGSGLGLALARAVVQAHRGTIELTSRPGRTVFTVRLPVWEAGPTAPDDVLTVPAEPLDVL